MPVKKATGGNALVHYADWILDFQGHASNTDRIWEGEEGKSKILGHFCEINFLKSPINKTGVKVKYPIKYLPDGTGIIWTSYEIADMMIMWEYVQKSGAWFNIREDIFKDLQSNGIDIPTKIQGKQNLRNFFEQNEKATKYMFDKFYNLVF